VSPKGIEEKQFEELEEEEEVEEFEEEEVSHIRIRGREATNTPPSIVLSVTYDGSTGKALVKLYDPYTDEVYYWYDNTGHKPYLITDIPPHEIVEKFPEVVKHRGFSHMELVSKYDALRGETRIFTKVYANDPLSIGGSRNAIRNMLPRTWESKIKYHHTYLFDRGLIPGMWYMVDHGNLRQADVEIPEEVMRRIEEALGEFGAYAEYREMVHEWLPVFQAPIPHIKRLAIDIEVLPDGSKVPDVKEAKQPVISIALIGSDGLRRILVLKREGVEADLEYLSAMGVEVMFFDNERDMLLEAFTTMLQYPIILTFNGDNFDLPYLYNRARNLKIPEDQIPIIPRRDYVAVQPGIHIDLYKFFMIKAVEAYAFGGKYRGERSLDAIANALIGIGKVEVRKPINEMSLDELIEYNYRDALITMYLSTFNNDLVMKLIFLFSRISKMPPEDLTRSQVSAWIRNMVYFEHRRRGWLIPNQDDIAVMRGVAQTKALIKGKKYAGAIVLDPPDGVFSDIYVLDFASLYPTVMRNWNLSYETVNCPDDTDKKISPVPDLKHWVCMNRLGISTMLISMLRDLRVHVYKKLAKTAPSQAEREFYDVVQSGMKVFINASYGVFGAENYPLYCSPVAELTTALGRYTTAQAIMKAVELGMAPIYGDTDSLFLMGATEDRLSSFIKYVSSELGVEVELDKVYRLVLFSGRKKNYLGLTRDGDVIIKGLVAKKRNAPPIVRQLLDEIVDMVKQIDSQEKLEQIRTEVMALVKRYEKALKERDTSLVTLDKLAIKVTLSKDPREYTKTKPQHVKAAEQLMRYGISVSRGDVISYVKTSDAVGVKPVQLARIDEIDWKKYIEVIESSVEQLLEAFGISLEELRGVKSLL